jgi:hypothetical protein
LRRIALPPASHSAVTAVAASMRAPEERRMELCQLERQLVKQAPPWWFCELGVCEPPLNHVPEGEAVLRACGGRTAHHLAELQQRASAHRLGREQVVALHEHHQRPQRRLLERVHRLRLP